MFWETKIIIIFYWFTKSIIFFYQKDNMKFINCKTKSCKNGFILGGVFLGTFCQKKKKYYFKITFFSYFCILIQFLKIFINHVILQPRFSTPIFHE